MTISHSRGNRIGWLGFAAALVFIGLATLVPAADSPKPDVSVICIRCGALGGPDLILNVVLFVPLGLALSALGLSVVRSMGVGLLLSIAIELTQILLPGRSTTLRDALCNAAGALIGALLAARLTGWLTPSRATLARLVAATVGAVGMVAAHGWLMQFSPSDPPYYGHWSPEQEHLERWTGRLSNAELDGYPVPNWDVADPDGLRAAIADGFSLGISGIGGAPTSDLGGILTISDAVMSELLLIGLDGEALVVRVRRRAAELRLGAPEARFSGLMRGAPEGAPLTMRIEASVSRTCATVNGTTDCVGPPATGSAWVLLFKDRSTSTTARILLNAVTLALLAFPIGLLFRGVTTAQGWAAISLLIVGTAVAARASGLASPTLVEWSGLVGGLVAGVVLNRLLMRTSAVPASVAPA